MMKLGTLFSLLSCKFVGDFFPPHVSLIFSYPSFLDPIAIKTKSPKFRFCTQIQAYRENGQARGRKNRERERLETILKTY